MPREYLCKMCGVSHLPRTGKGCTRERQLDDGEDSNVAENNGVEDGVMALLLDIRSKVERVDEKVENVDGRLRTIEDERESVAGSERSERAEEDSEMATDNEASNIDLMPSVLRNDVRTMRRAAERIAWLQLDDEDDEGATAMPLGRRSGKKSGANMVAADTVKKRIDWPHLYVKRRVAGTRVPVPYADIHINEFVYGFLIMLKSPKFTEDKDTMLDVLGMLMEDSMNFSWSNARGFYYMLGQDVEQGVRKWEDRGAIQEMQLLQSRAVFPDNKEAPSNVKKATPAKTPGTSNRCCALYQQKTCEHNRDHPPFAHACVYCLRVTNTQSKSVSASLLKRQ